MKRGSLVICALLGLAGFSGCSNQFPVSALLEAPFTTCTMEISGGYFGVQQSLQITPLDSCEAVLGPSLRKNFALPDSMKESYRKVKLDMLALTAGDYLSYPPQADGFMYKLTLTATRSSKVFTFDSGFLTQNNGSSAHEPLANAAAFFHRLANYATRLP